MPTKRPNLQVIDQSDYPAVREILWRTDTGNFILEQWHIRPSMEPDLVKRESVTQQAAITWMLVYDKEVPSDLKPIVDGLQL